MNVYRGDGYMWVGVSVNVYRADGAVCVWVCVCS